MHNSKRYILITLLVPLLGIVPRVIKNNFPALSYLLLYYLYICAAFSMFLVIAQFTKRIKNPVSKLIIGYIAGAALLYSVHILFFYATPGLLTFFLNVKNLSFGAVIGVTLFRSLLLLVLTLAVPLLIKKKETVNIPKDTNNANYFSRVSVTFQDKTMLINVSEIAFFYLENGILYICLFTGNRYILNMSLEQLEKKLNPQQFFRANRQFIISAGAITAVKNAENRKLFVITNPETHGHIIISKAKASVFLKWWKK
ncbi:LytTR family DNA-binding domain-containing protein [Flavobacterium sp.]|uniref:LytR/AlgR family response regulator transcription factor n=1 Tax=Flavobacterium sp. TaxID=239 RepID=UPI0026021324|nr:LytTR family DNA-binding domain-containing protein [Flavobacterium sp.]